MTPDIFLRGLGSLRLSLHPHLQTYDHFQAAQFNPFAIFFSLSLNGTERTTRCIRLLDVSEYENGNVGDEEPPGITVFAKICSPLNLFLAYHILPQLRSTSDDDKEVSLGVAGF